MSSMITIAMKTLLDLLLVHLMVKSLSGAYRLKINSDSCEGKTLAVYDAIFRNLDEHSTLIMVLGRINRTYTNRNNALLILAMEEWKRRKIPVKLSGLVFCTDGFKPP